MSKHHIHRHRAGRLLAALVGLALAAVQPARAADALRIGFSMSLSGGLAVTGKPALLATQIWAEKVNAEGGLLGRKVELVYYDDQSNPALVPSIYSKLLDIDKVDLAIPGYSTNMTAPFMPTAIERNLLVVSYFCLALNDQFHYPRYFSMVPFGPQPKIALSKGFFDIAAAQEPKPQTVAVVSADAEFALGAAEGARENLKTHGFKIVYDRTYPANLLDFSPVIRAAQAANPDIVYVASYPADGAGVVRAANEVRLKTKLFGGSMVGMQSTPLRMQLGPLLNGLVYHDFWVPDPKLMFPGIEAFLATYQARAIAAGADPLGYYAPPYAYARMQVMGQAIAATGTLDADKLATYLHANVLHTIVGDIRFNQDGEWSKSGVLTVQYQGIVGNGLDQFRKPSTYVVLAPDEFKSAAGLVYPYSNLHD
ncbi:MAG: amino acid ABC transporter substrate-binding protein [Xanthobacteraceae bacterium]